jgi:predicted Zn finger-like uncharacterized protein
MRLAVWIGRRIFAAMADPSDFRCPECGAIYKVEQVSEPAETLSEIVCCKHCLHSFPSKEGNFTLRYVLVAHPL